MLPGRLCAGALSISGTAHSAVEGWEAWGMAEQQRDAMRGQRLEDQATLGESQICQVLLMKYRTTIKARGLLCLRLVICKTEVMIPLSLSLRMEKKYTL